jgi:hypothetical protein
MTDRMDSVDHTHPTQDAVADAYRRGGTGLRADGSGRDAADGDAGTDRTRMRDVSHTPPDGDGTNDVWARGETEERPVRDDDE